MKKKPEGLKPEHLTFLNELRESGKTNMMGAVTYMLREFRGLGEAEARKILFYWMDTFGER